MADAFNVAMGRVLSDLRRSHGLSLKDVGLHLGLSYQQVNKYAGGVNAIPASSLPKLATLFGTTVADLYARAGIIEVDHEPTEAEADSFLAARYVGKIPDAFQRRALIDYARKLAYQPGEAA